MTPALPSGVPSTAMAFSNEAPAGFQNSTFSFDGSAAMDGTCRGATAAFVFAPPIDPNLEDNGITFDVTRTGHGCSVLLFLNRSGTGLGQRRGPLERVSATPFYHPYRLCEDGRGW